jgi:hypothetical protein
MTDVQERQALPAGMQQLRLLVKQGSLHFTGVKLAEEDNDTGDRLRWAQLILFKGFGTNAENPETYGREYYLLYAVGHSLVVHALDGCRGTAAMVSKFSDPDGSAFNEDFKDLEACPDCDPDFTLDSPPDARFKVEVTRYSHTQHPSATALADALRKCRNCGHRPHDQRPACGCGCKHYVKGDLSQIGQRLLDKARDKDPAIAAVLPPAEIRL